MQKIDNLPACYSKIQTIVAVTTGNQIKNITPQADLTVDLGLNLDIELPEIIIILNQEYEDEDLDLDPGEIKQELLAAKPTVEELSKIVQEARELG